MTVNRHELNSKETHIKQIDEILTYASSLPTEKKCDFTFVF